jgi:hypothetical protein
MNHKSILTCVFVLLFGLQVSLTATPTLAGVPDDANRATDAATLPAIVSGDWWTAVQEDILQSEYQVSWQDQTYLSDRSVASTEPRTGAYQAPNRAHNLRTYFNPSSIHIIPRTTPTDETPSWEWDLTLTRYGHANNLQPIAPAELATEGNCIEYRRGDLVEWYVNDKSGLEQGFRIETLPGEEISPKGRIRAGPGTEGYPLLLEMALTSNLTPHLTGHGRAVELTTSSGAHLLRYSNLQAYDAAGRMLPTHMNLVAISSASRLRSYVLRLIVDDSGATYPITIASLATSPSWTAEGDQAGAGYGMAAGTAGDVNGDGYADIIVGAYAYDNGQANEGRVFVYHGSASGLSPAPDWMAESDLPEATFGYVAETAGDVNGDGYTDVIVGAMGSDRAYVFHGSAMGLPDADGDGLAHPGDADWTSQSDQSGAAFGRDAGTAGDVNDDGYDEVIVGAFLYTNGQFEEGRVFLYYGSAAGLSSTADWMAESDLPWAHSGFANGTAGDVNGDGYDDVIVGAHYNMADRAFVFYGSAAGLPDADGDGLAHPSDADWTARSDQNNSRFGTTVGTAGDVNGDGYDDVIIGDNFYHHEQSYEGRAFVYHGSATGLPDADGDGVAYPDDANWMAESDQTGAYFARTAGTAGDVNGDGYDDVIIGTMGSDRAYVFLGSAMGLPDADGDGLAHPGDADWAAQSDQSGALFGYAVNTAGDVNNDGYDEVIVGAWQYDSGENNEGAAFVFQYLTPAEATQDLIDTVKELNLQQGIENNLDVKLDAVLQALDDLNQHNDVAAVNALQAFINAVEAQRGKALTEAQADQLIDMAQAIISSLSG